MWIRCRCAGWLCASRAATGWPRWRAITRGTFFNGTLLPRSFRQIVSFPWVRTDSDDVRSAARAWWPRFRCWPRLVGVIRF